VVFTPKSMLKRKEAASQPADFTGDTTFRPFIGDETADRSKVTTLLLCSGRATWDLLVARATRENGDTVAIGRVERLYPQPIDDIKAEIAKFPNLQAVRWVQDEPANMGPWPNYALNVWQHLDVDVEPVTRLASASPSVGTVKRHVEEQKGLLDKAFASPSPRNDY
jgi:2-oxoglutarate dehydrogenase E1 component